MDSDGETGVGSTPVPDALPGRADVEVTFEKGKGTELLDSALALVEPRDVDVKDSKVDAKLGDAPVPDAVPVGPGIDVMFVRG